MKRGPYRRRRPIVRLRTYYCSRGCGARVVETGPCVVCMTPDELRKKRKEMGR